MRDHSANPVQKRPFWNSVTIDKDLGFEFFNGDGSPDVVTEQDARNFKEYEYTADALPEFTGFVVKIVGQSSNTSIVPLVSALRCIALA